MQPLTRRGFLAGTAAGVAAAGVAVVLPGGAASAATRAGALAGGGLLPSMAETADESLGEPVIAHIRDLSSGEIVLFRGENETIVHDRRLASRLASASRSR